MKNKKMLELDNQNSNNIPLALVAQLDRALAS